MPKFYSNVNFKSFGSNSVSSNVAVDSSGIVIKGSTSGTGGTGGTMKIEREKLIYLDLVNGNDTTAATNYSDNNFVYPYQTYASAASGATSGQTIVMLPGTYTGIMELKDGVTIYCEPGVNITNGGFTSSTAVTSEILGYAKFSGTSSYPALNVFGGTGVNSNITFEFDTITGTRLYGIYHDSDGTLTVRGNSIFCEKIARIQSNTKNINININNFMRAYGNEGIIIGKYFQSAPYPIMTGEIIITCPLIESTSATTYRCLLLFEKALQHSPPKSYRVVINSKILRMSTSPVEAAWPVSSAAVIIVGGDNIHVYGDIIGNTAHCVVNLGGGATPHYGSYYFNGNMESDIPVISMGCRVANGNGWHNVSVNGGYLKTKGTAGYGLIETTNTWNNIHGGNPGTLYLKNCILHNLTTDSTVLVLNGPYESSFLSDCLIYSPGTTGFAANSIYGTKKVNYTNTTSNKINNTTISSNLTSPSFIYEVNLDIPK